LILLVPIVILNVFLDRFLSTAPTFAQKIAPRPQVLPPVALCAVPEFRVGASAMTALSDTAPTWLAPYPAAPTPACGSDLLPPHRVLITVSLA
jgi:hypothetical protein